MPRPKSQIPGYSLHRPSGQACVYIDRQRIYLGRYGSPESKSKYSAIIADRAAGVSSNAAVEPQASPNLLTVNELCLKFATEVLPKYRTSGGKPSAEQDCFKGVIKILRRLFGESRRLRLARGADGRRVMNIHTAASPTLFGEGRTPSSIAAVSAHQAQSHL